MQSPETSASPMLDYLREHAPIDTGIDYASYIQAALYAPGIGYYQRNHERVGHRAGTDFYTASSMGTLFGRLVADASATLLAPCARAADASFVEVGSEPGAPILSDMAHAFAHARTIRLGESLSLASPDPQVVFSNELFDAQPFRRFVSRDGAWRELGVRWNGSQLEEVEMGNLSSSALSGPDGGRSSEQDFDGDRDGDQDRDGDGDGDGDQDALTGAGLWEMERLLPERVPGDGYVFDAPTGAVELLGQLVAQDWKGLFVAFDYGHTLQTLAAERPEGTARTYSEHRMGSNLLERPGEIDITCHVCWDWMTEVLERHGFQDIRIESQEFFFMHHATDTIARIISSSTGSLGPEKSRLMQLLHPENMGAKFQVLHAIRM